MSRFWRNMLLIVCTGGLWLPVAMWQTLTERDLPRGQVLYVVPRRRYQRRYGFSGLGKLALALGLFALLYFMHFTDKACN